MAANEEQQRYPPWLMSYVGSGASEFVSKRKQQKQKKNTFDRNWQKQQLSMSLDVTR